MTPAAWGFTERDRAQIRAKESAVLERMAKKVEAVISDPPLVHSAIGKTVEDPWCPGSYLINESVRVAARRERRLPSESFRRLTGADLGSADKHMTLEAAQQTMLADINRRRAELAALPAPPHLEVIDGEIVD